MLAARVQNQNSKLARQQSVLGESFRSHAEERLAEETMAEASLYLQVLSHGPLKKHFGS